jgi:tape measure domain-containing protein
MAGEIKGLQVDVSMDTSKFERGFSQIKRSMSTFNSALKNTRNEIKFGEKSQQSYKNHMDNLKTSIAKSETNVKQLSKAYEGLSEEQKQGVKGHQFISQMAKEEDQMRRLKNELKSTQLTYGETYTAMGKIGQSFKSVGAGMQNVGSQMQGVGKNLTNSITKPALVAGGALAGIALTKGFGRLVEIDTAEAKLSALGNSAKDTKAIMDNALESVKGTSFGMGEAATTAANAVAAGIKPGKELTQYLTNTADAAAIAGADMSEMGSIMNKVQTQNKAYNGELQQLSDRGLPVYQWLAKEANVTAEEVTEMASKGKISSKMLQDAIKNNIGGAAKEMGKKSFTAALSNMWAALGRVGAAFLDAGGKGGGFFSKLKPIMNNLTDTFDNMGPHAEKWGVALGNAFAKVIDGVTGIVKWYQDLDKGTQKTLGGIVKWLAITLVTVGPLLTIFGKLVTVTGGMFTTFGALAGSLGRISFMAKEAGSLMGGLQAVFPKLATSISVMTGPVGWITAGVVALGIAFFVAYKKSETFRNIVNKAVTGVMNTFKAAMGIVKGFFQLFKGNGQDGVITLSKILPPDVVVGLTNFADTVKRVFFQVINAVKTFAMQIGQMLSKFWKENGAEITQAVKNIGSVISTVFRFIWGSIIKPIMNLIWNIMKLLWPAIKLLIVDTWNNIKNIIKGALDVIMGVIKIFSSLFTGNWKGMWQGVKQATGGALKLIWAAVQLWFIGKILKVVRLFGGLFKGAISGIWKVIKGIFNRSLGAIFRTTKNIFTNIFKVTKSIFTNVKNFLFNIWNNIRKGVTSRATSLWNGVRNTWNNLRKGTSSIFTAVRNFAFKIWTNIKNKIVSLAQSIWNNVRNKFNGMFKSVKNILNNLFNTSRNIFTNIKNRVTNLANVAKDNVVNGFKAMYDKGKSWINKLKDFITGSKDSFKKAALSLGKSAANGAIGGLNKMIGGINKISKAITDKSLIKKIPTLHTGGTISSPTTAVVNDKGRGNGTGINGHQEIIAKRDGSLHAPIGRNVLVGLDKGDSVLNGKHTQDLMNRGILPRFNKGKNSKNKYEEFKNTMGAGVKATGKSIEKGYHSAKEGASDAKDYLKEKGTQGIEKVKDGASWLGDKIGDVWDYVKNPKKLVDKMLGGISFGGKKANATMRMAGGAFNKLKKSFIDKVKSMFAEAEGGDGDAGWLLKHKILQTFGHYTGGLMFNGGRHYGIDFAMPTGTPIKALTDGKISQAGWVNGGGGNQVTLDEPGGKWFQWYMHMKNGGVKVKKGQKVKAGDLLGLSGSTGNSTTPHLHIQRMKGYPSNDTAVDPMKWLKSLGTGGGSKAASKWRSDIVKAGKSMGVKLSGGDIKDVIRLIDTESSGNPRVKQGIQDVNSGGNEARGLLQYTPGTFAGYAAKGSKNILNGYHQLKAFFNNSNWRRDLSAWKARMARGATGWGPTGSKRGYATGGLINANGLYNLAEDGHPEFVIPTDPKRQSDAMKLLAIASQRIEGNKKNKRPNQMRTPSPTASNNNAETLSMLAKMVEQQQEQINILTKIALSNQDIADKPVMGERDMSKAQGRRSQMMSYHLGGAF